MKQLSLLIALSLLLLTYQPLLAARLDKNGCYTSKKTGEYICPHGNKGAANRAETTKAKREAKSEKITTTKETTRKETKTASVNNCCRFCKTGKPCGDACIAKNEACHKERGCACEFKAE